MRPLLALVLLLTACEPARPLRHFEARSAAVNWCIREGKDWGEPTETIAPGSADERGRRWWTVRFAGGTVLVDGDSGWTMAGPMAAPAPAPTPAP